jgi:sporulation protein YlmC with PRC-barrel domain
MDIPSKVQVHCEDGLCGHSAEVVLDPKTDEITHLVVKEHHTPHTERLVPVSLVQDTTPHLIPLLWGKKDVTIPVSEIDCIEETVIHLKLDRQRVEVLPAIPIRRRELQSKRDSGSLCLKAGRFTLKYRGRQRPAMMAAAEWICWHRRWEARRLDAAFWGVLSRTASRRPPQQVGRTTPEAGAAKE